MQSKQQLNDLTKQNKTRNWKIGQEVRKGNIEACFVGWSPDRMRCLLNLSCTFTRSLESMPSTSVEARTVSELGVSSKVTKDKDTVSRRRHHPICTSKVSIWFIHSPRRHDLHKPSQFNKSIRFASLLTPTTPSIHNKYKQTVLQTDHQTQKRSSPSKERW